MRLIVKADASVKLGAGHVMRSLAIAEEAISQNIETFFAGKIESLDWLTDRVRQVEGLVWIDCVDCFAFDAKHDILLLDSYTLPVNHEFIDSRRWRNIVTLVDELTPSYKSDLKIHPGLVWDQQSSPNTIFGSKFIPLRKSITKESRPESRPLNVLLVGGGTNVNNVVNAVAKELQLLTLEFHAWVFSETFDDSLALDTRFQRESIGVSLDVFASKADLVFTTASTTSMEFIAREKAVGVTCAIDNQCEYFRVLTQSGLAAPVGIHKDDSWQMNSGVIERLLLDKEYRFALRKKTENFIDLRGSTRIVAKILQLP